MFPKTKISTLSRSNAPLQIIGGLLLGLLFISLACTIPGLTGRDETIQVVESQAVGEAQHTPTPTPQPTQTPLPLPPVLVEAVPPDGSTYPLAGALTLYFNQSMDRGSVEGALTGQPTLSGSINWLDDATLVFEPDTPFLPGSDLFIEVGQTARAKNGEPLVNPIRLSYQTASSMRAVQVLPEPDLSEVDPTSAIVVTFDQPVVPLGADPLALPQAFTIEPAAQGQGEWINTSTYLFSPDPPLFGGQTYTVRLNSDLRSTNGSPFDGLADSPGLYVWSFSTAAARLVSLEPGDGATAVRLDAPFELTFNQPMAPASVQDNFALLGPGAASVSGEFGWNEDFTTLTFTPTQRLALATDYSAILLGTAQARGGNPLGVDTSARIHTVPALRVTGSRPASGGLTRIYEGVTITFSGPVETKDPLRYTTITPPVSNLSYWWDSSNNRLSFTGNFDPLTQYQLTLSGALPDPWGGTLGSDYVFDFRTAALDASLYLAHGSLDLFLTPQESTVLAQATNLGSIDLTLGSIPFADAARIFAPGGYDFRRNYSPADAQRWTYALDLPGDRSYSTRLPITPSGAPLPPGLYFLNITSAELPYSAGPYVIVSSNVHLTYKLSTSQAFVWALDLRENTPVADAPITLYADDGSILASGNTDAQGIFQSAIPEQADLYTNSYVVLGQPGKALFAFSLSSWSAGVEGYDFGLFTDYNAPGLKTYLYTDRPVYRPGDTVHFRAVVRQAHNGRYSLPDLSILPVTIKDTLYQPLLSLELPLSTYGTAHGKYSLPENAAPGYYEISAGQGSLYFQVAEYRKPEINLQVSASPNPAVRGDSIVATVNARYFFDAPASNLPLRWNLSAMPEYLYLAGYDVGVDDYTWMLPPWMGYYGIFGEYIASGEGTTNSEGLLTIELPSLPEGDAAKRYTLEVTIQDESEFPVSERVEVVVHPADFYIGVKPDAWVAQAGEEIGFEVKTVDWDLQPLGSLNLSARFRKITWRREESPYPFGIPSYIPEYTPVASTDFATGANGLARLAFTPPEPGTYELEISGPCAGACRGTARTQTLIWVGGAGQVVWPNLPNQQIELTADRDHYQPGDTAQVFIPNPLGAATADVRGYPVQALITIERGQVMRHQVVTLAGDGYDLALPLTAEEAPNVYVSVTLVGRDANGKITFRQGYLNLLVEPLAQTLQVEVNSPQLQDSSHFGPRDEVTFEVRVTDAAGNPVQGEFSLAVVDLAALALAQPNSIEIVDAFYGVQPLGVRTGLALAVHADRTVETPGGLGGGGGDAVPLQIREEFPDTAYWNAEIVTDADGRAQVTLTLPDSLTTWQVDVRGLTEDTRVGQQRMEVVTTKDLLVRPVTPRFVVVGDHLQLAAIVHNNTGEALEATVGLQAAGFMLDDPGTATQTISLPAGGRLRVNWWGTVEDIEALDLVFSASGGGFSDATRPVWGDLAVLRYSTPQTFATAGTLDQAGEKLEIVNLPRTFDASGGNLQVELAPSLAAAMTAGLDVLEHYPYECTEQTLSRFLPNLEAYRAIQSLGLNAPDLKDRLDRTLNEGLQRLIYSQNADGGWGWWPESTIVEKASDPYLTAYVLFGLGRARNAGVFVDETVIQQAVNYLLAVMPSPAMLSDSWQLDRLAFEHFALAQAGSGDPSGTSSLFNLRDQLSPWARAFLALSLESLVAGDERVDLLLSDLEATALRSASGAHWEGGNAAVNMETPVFNTAAVVYAIAQNDPAAVVLPEAMRYLMAARAADGGWSSTYETAWALLALTEVMKGTGELAGDFGFAATLNGLPFVTGQAGGEARLNPVRTSVPVADLYPADPNALLIQHEAGPGRLYYTAHLNVLRPVAEVGALNRGFSVTRSYEQTGEKLAEWRAGMGDLIRVRVAVTLQQDAYYLVVEDYIPAGAEILDTSLETSQQILPQFDARDPFEAGWGWWIFSPPKIYDDRVAWAVDYVPAGTYEFTYTLVLNQAGEYGVLPARAWQFYFPEVQGNSAGGVFVIEE